LRFCNYHILRIYFLALSCILYSCKKSTVDPVAIDKAYFPLQTGKYIIYDVDSIAYSNFFNSTDTFSYQIKEVVDSPYMDASNQTAYAIIRSVRADENSPWILKDIWSANLTDHTAEKVEENLRFIKLDFPVLLNKTWKGNSLINTDSSLLYLKDWDYEYTEVNTIITVDTMQFDSVVTVTQLNEQNVIQKMIFVEKYARSIGLIYKEQQNIETQPGQYLNGYILTMIIREYN
jgi:hypothetical protein